MKILLVAKPWRGGLARYLEAGLNALRPGSVTWLPTYPVSASEKLSYRRDRAGWRRRLAQRVADSNSDVTIFINHVPGFEALPRRDGHLLWITDDPLPVLGKLEPYARVFVSDPGYRGEVAEALGGRFRGVLDFACLPSVHRPGEYTGRPRGFCFIGNRDPKRDPYLRRLCSGGRAITVYGNYFPLHPLCWRYPRRFRPSVPVDRMAGVYARHVGSINVHAAVVRGGTNMRTFECAGYGIAQVVERLPGLEALFTPGEDLLTFSGSEQLVEQIERLEADPGFARSLASSAARRALAQHTYFHRVRTLLDGFLDLSAREIKQAAGG